jgi:hypothetical protein
MLFVQIVLDRNKFILKIGIERLIDFRKFFIDTLIRIRNMHVYRLKF